MTIFLIKASIGIFLCEFSCTATKRWPGLLRGQEGAKYPDSSSFREPALLSNAMWIGFGCRVFCVWYLDLLKKLSIDMVIEISK